MNKIQLTAITASSLRQSRMLNNRFTAHLQVGKQGSEYLVLQFLIVSTSPFALLFIYSIHFSVIYLYIYIYI